MKFIFITGGVLSGLGKGIVTSAISLLLKNQALKVTAIKIDPYISIDAGTMRPAEHGEIFVTHDGGEIDQDLGHYERYLDLNLPRENNITTGKVFQNVIQKERSFFYQGRDAELIPDVINEIKELIYHQASGYDLAVVEVGGTTGDLENMPFLHAAREISKEYPTIFAMVTYLPYLKNVGELKTKPTQHAVARLREIGIVPDFIITRNEIPIDQPRVENISKRCFINQDHIIDDPDLPNVHRLPLIFNQKKLTQKILRQFNLPCRKPSTLLAQWKLFVNHLENSHHRIHLGLIGKYLKHGHGHHKDVYLSVVEAVNHAAASLKIKADITPIDSETLEHISSPKLHLLLSDYQGLIIPQGWGARGTEGKIAAIQYAREHCIPFLGLCFGMQMALIEIGRHLLNLKSASSEEINPATPHPVIHLMPHQKAYLQKKQYGGTIRLGAWPCKILPDTLLSAIYSSAPNSHCPWHTPNPTRPPHTFKCRVVFERHRHRYEFNNHYRQSFKKAGVIFSGVSPDNQLVEAIELKNHPFFLGTQFHPEYLSRPLRPHPIFISFLKAALTLPPPQNTQP